MITPVSPQGSPTEFDLSLADAFERTAKAYPDRVAVDSGRRRLTYSQLNAAANRLARDLVSLGGAEGDRAAILMAHDVPSIAAVVGAVKARRIVLGLSCTDPVQRLKLLIDDAQPSVVIADAGSLALATELAGSSAVLVFDPDDEAESADFSSPAVDPGQTAALVYTSGSTGRPKGVMKTHRQIVRNVAAHTEAMQYSQADRIPLFSSIGSGQGTTVVWCALLNGATLCPFPIREQGFAGLSAWIVNQQLTVYVSSASIFRALVKALDSGLVFGNIRAVRLASESVSDDDVRALRRHFSSDCVFVHTLSSSETGNIAWSRWSHSDDIPAGRLPVGSVSRGIDVLLLDANGEPVEIGEIGELAVRSRYAAAGYWGDPALTIERFSSEFDEDGTRLVRNGDLARVNARGLIEYCGRKDNRIKIRGNRIELSDVESALSRLPGIGRVAAVAMPREGNEPILVAFVVLSRDATWSAKKLRHAAAANLPLHMLPSRIVFLDDMPLGAGGKIDREFLRRHELPRRASGDPPRGVTETLIADVWAEVLDIPDVRRDDDFFDAGGDSLNGAIVSAHIHSAFGIEIGLAALADNSTVAALAAYVDARRKAGGERASSIVPVPRTGPIPLSLFQEHVWLALERRPSRALTVRSYEILGPLDVEAMEECFRYLVDRHEILRTTFAVVDGKPAQIVHPDSPLGFRFVDVSGESDPEVAAESVCKTEAAKPFDFSVLPVTRFVLTRLAGNRHWLMRVGHALGHDASSFATILAEFGALYDARVKGMAPPIPKSMPLQYADYSVWHRERMRPEGSDYRETLDWWKELFAKRVRTTRLTHRRKVHPGVTADPNHATHPWLLEEGFSERLDATARGAGMTHFVVRLACFVALLATLTGRSTVVLGTSFTNRQRSDTRNIAGLFTNLVPLVFSYRRDILFSDWLKIVGKRLFETEKYAELPLEAIYDKLRADGLRPPSILVLFNMASEWSEERIGDIVMKRRPPPAPEMPWGFQVYVDPNTPTNCRVEFDARLYRHCEVRAIVDRYVRLLEAAAEHPDLPIGKLVGMTGVSRPDGLRTRLRAALSKWM